MTFSVSEMLSYIDAAGGLAKSNRFSVMVTPPAWATGSTQTPRLIQMFADQAALPGLTFATNDVKNLGYGPIFKLPHTPIYTDIDCSIMLDNNGDILQFFTKWMQNIVNINPDGSPSTSGYNGAKMYSVQYPSNYVTTVSIMLYDAEANTIVTYDLNDAYPLRIGQPVLDWSQQNAVLRLPVTFTYKTWSSTLFNANDQTLSNSIASFDPFAFTLSGSLYDSTTSSYVTLAEVLLNTATSLINNNTSSLLNIFT